MVHLAKLVIDAACVF